MPRVFCQVCQKEFYAKPNWVNIGWGKYCSQICFHESQKKGQVVDCFICGKRVYKSRKELKSSKSKNFFCSKSCQTIWRNSVYVGSMHPRWRTGISIYKKLLIREGKNYLCSRCGEKDERVLAVHHIDKDRKNNKLDNLAWLCHNCHYLIHHYGQERDKFMEMLV